MSNEYLNKTEEQQFEEAKSWLKENGTPIIVAIALACFVSFGWNFWKNHQIEKTQRISANYQAVMESYLQNPTQNTPLIEKFISENKETTYAFFSQLEAAKQAVAQSEFAKAKELLQAAATTANDSSIQNIARMRLAQVDYQLKAYDEALITLSQIKDQAWELRKQVLTGDILASKGDIEAAKNAYKQAKSNALPQELILIEARLNNL